MNVLITLKVTADCNSESGSRPKDHGNDGRKSKGLEDPICRRPGGETCYTNQGINRISRHRDRWRDGTCPHFSLRWSVLEGSLCLICPDFCQFAMHFSRLRSRSSASLAVESFLLLRDAGRSHSSPCCFLSSYSIRINRAWRNVPPMHFGVTAWTGAGTLNKHPCSGGQSF